MNGSGTASTSCTPGWCWYTCPTGTGCSSRLAGRLLSADNNLSDLADDRASPSRSAGGSDASRDVDLAALRPPVSVGRDREWPGRVTGIPGVPDRSAAATRPEQDAHHAGRGGTGDRCPAPGGAAAAVLPVGVDLEATATTTSSGPREAGLPFVMALKPRRGACARGMDAHTSVEAARALTWTDVEHPGEWTPVVRTFRDGHTETWRAADARLGGRGPDGFTRLVVATAWSMGLARSMVRSVACRAGQGGGCWCYSLPSGVGASSGQGRGSVARFLIAECNSVY